MSGTRRSVTGEDVQSLADAILTDIAREWIEKKRLRIVTKAKAKKAGKVRVALGSDHRGFALKEAVKALLEEMGASFTDYGTHSTQPVDYPDFAHAVALAVALGRAELGIVVDGSGVGSAIVANKVPGIRAAPCSDEAAARGSREHIDTNVLGLGARVISKETMAKVVRTFLASDMSKERHRFRVRKIFEIEKKYYRPV